MADILTILTYIGILLLVGIIITIISNKLKLPPMLLLILVGIIAGNFTYQGRPWVEFPPLFLTGMGIFALVMIIFDGTAKFNIREMDKVSLDALKLTGIFILLTLTILSAATYFIYGIKNITLVLMFSALMAGTSAEVVMSLFGKTRNKLLEILEVESIINTPITVLLPFIMLEFGEIVNVQELFTKTVEQITPFITQIIVGVGSGIIIGIIAFKVMRKAYSETLSPLAIITAALLTYILAENLNGNGVLAVTTLGLFFGNLKVKQKVSILGFETIFANALRILLFILLGLIIKIPLTGTFILQSLTLFVIYLIIRYLAIEISFNKTFSIREKVFMALNASKGIAVAVVAFFLLSYTIVGMKQILDLTLAFIIYSIVVAAIVSKFSKYLIKEEMKVEK